VKINDEVRGAPTLKLDGLAAVFPAGKKRD
jgi:hypothetical protein